MKTLEPHRRLPLTGAVNFRDIGGYPTADGRMTRWHTVYRSDSLADLTAADVAVVDALGLRTICDFRLPFERESKPDRLPDDTAIRVETPGFLPAGTIDMLREIDAGRFGPRDIAAHVEGHYALFITDHVEDFARFFALILEDETLPLLVHCTSGKDRTGVAIAVLLLALGVDRQTIVDDYTMTNDFRRDIGHLFSNAVSAEAIQMLTSANARYIEAALDAIEPHHGSADAFFGAMGLTPADRAELTHRLTEAR